MAGYAVNTQGFPDRGPAVFGVAVATLVLCTVFVAARMVCRISIVRRVSWDDYFIVAAWALAFGVTFTIAFGTQKGLGRHDSDIVPERRAGLRQSEPAVQGLTGHPGLVEQTALGPETVRAPRELLDWGLEVQQRLLVGSARRLGPEEQVAPVASAVLIITVLALAVDLDPVPSTPMVPTAKLRRERLARLHLKRCRRKNARERMRWRLTVSHPLQNVRSSCYAIPRSSSKARLTRMMFRLILQRSTHR